MRRYARPRRELHPRASRLSMVPFPLSRTYLYPERRPIPPLPPPPAASVPRPPLDCIDHRWRGCTRRKRLVTRARRIVTSMASSHIGITHIHGSHVIFPQTRLRLFGTNSPPPSSASCGFAKQFATELESARARVRFPPFPFSGVGASIRRLISIARNK